MNKRLLFGALAGVTVFAAVNGSAASLGTISSGGLGAASVGIASCDTDGVTTSYTTAYNTTDAPTTAAGYKVDDITVSGINELCSGKTMKITLVGASNASLGQVTATLGTIAAGASGTSTVDFLATNKLAQDVQGIHVTIGG